MGVLIFSFSFIHSFDYLFSNDIYLKLFHYLLVNLHSKNIYLNSTNKNKIFVSNLDQVLRIRTGELNEDAL